VPFLAVGSVKNIGLDSSYIYNYEKYSTAAIVGGGHEVINGTIENCYVGANVTVSGLDVAGIAGGGVSPGSVVIKNCYSLATLNGSGAVGGILASAWQNDVWKMENCYCIGKAQGSTWQPAAVSNVYETVQNTGVLVTDDSLKGELASSTLQNFDFDYIWKTTDSYPVLRVFEGEINESEFDKVYWNGTISAPFDFGDGTFEISTAEQLAYVISTGG
jgi:hypothetical protein